MPAVFLAVAWIHNYITVALPEILISAVLAGVPWRLGVLGVSLHIH